MKTHKASTSGPRPLAPDDSKQCFSPFSLQGPSLLWRNGHGPLSEKCISISSKPGSAQRSRYLIRRTVAGFGGQRAAFSCVLLNGSSCKFGLIVT